MKVADQLTPAEIRTNAEKWFQRQCAISALAMGPDKWAKHRDWIEAYLKQEIKQRLIARGWTNK